MVDERVPQCQILALLEPRKYNNSFIEHKFTYLVKDDDEGEEQQQHNNSNYDKNMYQQTKSKKKDRRKKMLINKNTISNKT